MPHRCASLLLSGLAVLAVASPAIAGLTATPALASTGASTQPADPRDFPDPSILYDGISGTYFAYATGNNDNIQVMSSSDLASWSLKAEALPTLPPWAITGRTWAPGVAKIGARYIMYYTAEQGSTGDECIGVATSVAPGGPFVDTASKPFVCQTNKGGSIDANPIVINSKPYLLWKSDDNHIGNNPTRLWSQALTSDGLNLVSGPPTLLLTGSLYDWRRPIIEGPTMVANLAGSYDLFYGAGWWDTTSAGIGYATCPGPLAACSNRSTSAAWMGTDSTINKNGPSGPSIFTDAAGKVRIAYHAWGSSVGYPQGQRKLWIDTLSFTGTTPSIP